jgi:hypothetical protein
LYGLFLLKKMIDTNFTSPASPFSNVDPSTSNSQINPSMSPTMGGSVNTGSTGFTANNKPAQKKLSPKMVVGLLALVLTVIGAGAGLLLTETRQDLRQQASGDPYAIGCCVYKSANTYQAGMTPSECSATGGTPANCNSFCREPGGCSGYTR